MTVLTIYIEILYSKRFFFFLNEYKRSAVFFFPLSTETLYSGLYNVLLLIMTLNLAVNQAKATYGPVGTTSERERPAGARSPLESRCIVWGHVCAAPTGQEEQEKAPKNKKE